MARIGGDEFAILAVEAEPGSKRRMLALLEENIEKLNAQEHKTVPDLAQRGNGQVRPPGLAHS